jgi:trans-aconitate methyltransferase
MPMQEWNAAQYQRHGGFVPELGQPVLDLLAPRPGERILDLGCGDGALTRRLVEAGSTVVGVDASPAMIAAARARGLDAHVMNGQRLSFKEEFDAVFTNAALHWMPDADAVIAGVGRALVPGGRFVGEMGGQGNVAAITVALRAVLQRSGVDAGSAVPAWYFPPADLYREKLEAHGFEVRSIDLIPRPTLLPGDIADWLDTFAAHWLAVLPEAGRAAARAEAADLLRPVLCDERGRWTADYVRLRFAAVRTH